LQYEVLDRLHRRAELLQIELHVTLRHVAGALVQQTLGGVIAQSIAQSADDRSKGAPQIVGRERHAALRHDVDDLPMRVGNAASSERIGEYPVAV